MGIPFHEMAHLYYKSLTQMGRGTLEAKRCLILIIKVLEI